MRMNQFEVSEGMVQDAFNANRPSEYDPQLYNSVDEARIAAIKRCILEWESLPDDDNEEEEEEESALSSGSEERTRIWWGTHPPVKIQKASVAKEEEDALPAALPSGFEESQCEGMPLFTRQKTYVATDSEFQLDHTIRSHVSVWIERVQSPSRAKKARKEADDEKEEGIGHSSQVYEVFWKKTVRVWDYDDDAFVDCHRDEAQDMKDEIDGHFCTYDSKGRSAAYVRKERAEKEVKRIRSREWKNIPRAKGGKPPPLTDSEVRDDGSSHVIDQQKYIAEADEWDLNHEIKVVLKVWIEEQRLIEGGSESSEVLSDKVSIIE